ncbi:hypothetical protein U9R90_19635 [Streptomyces sp. E11-3]|uniref:hypothetical protein n=1 Tax=Streptomyces sp. E11-3 TaxID=3110112 RepID=UPI00397F2C44
MRRLARSAVTLISATALLAVASGLLDPPLFGLRPGDGVVSRPMSFRYGCFYGLILLLSAH